MEAYRTQNRFLNSEIHQVTKIWRKVAEKERALLMKVRGGTPVLATLAASSPSLACLSLLTPVCSPLGCARRALSARYPASRSASRSGPGGTEGRWVSLLLQLFQAPPGDSHFRGL